MATPKVHKFFLRIVSEVIEYRERNNVTRADYLQHLISLVKKGRTVDDEDTSNGYEQKGFPPEQISKYKPSR
jgi:hypothetical protein